MLGGGANRAERVVSVTNLLGEALGRGDFIWRDLKWIDRAPVVLVEPFEDGALSGRVLTLPLAPGDFLGLELLTSSPLAGSYCTGFAVARQDQPGFTQQPCPSASRLSKGKQCATCLARDEFAPIHRVHLGAVMKPAALAYVNLEHFLYIATFPDGSSKVGTASLHSNPRRLDEQAVARATFIARATNGQLVRTLEDAVSALPDLTQFKRGSAKYKAWLAPAPSQQIEAEHTLAVQQATWELEDLAADGLQGFEMMEDPWQPSPAMGRAYSALDAEPRRPLTAYTTEERTYGFIVSGGTGKFLTGHCGDPDQDFLVNTLDLTNRACTTRQGLHQPAPAQASLF